VLAGLLFAWMLLDQVPAPVQVAGGVLVLAGIVVVKLGEVAIADQADVTLPTARPAA
jgi:drug/metabolite transporter (DMT)-like permease